MIIATAIAGVAKGLAMSFLSEKVLQKVVLILLTKLVESTDNSLDNQVLDVYKAQIKG